MDVDDDLERFILVYTIGIFSYLVHAAGINTTELYAQSALVIKD